MNVSIEHLRGTHPRLYCMYPRQQRPQPAYIELDTRTGRMRADYDGEIGNAVPMDVRNGTVRRYYTGTMSNDDANDLMDVLAPEAQRVLDGVANAAETIDHLCATWDAEPVHWQWATDRFAGDDEVEAQVRESLRAGWSAYEVACWIDANTVQDGTEHAPMLEGIQAWVEGLA